MLAKAQRRQSFGQTQDAFREGDDGQMPSFRRCRHQHANPRAQPLVTLGRKPRVDDPAFAFGGDDVIAVLCNHITQPRLWVDGDLLALSVPVRAALAGGADAENLDKIAPKLPSGEVEMLAAFCIG